MAEEKKKNMDELESSADSLLKKLNWRFDSDTESSKIIVDEKASAAKAALEDTLGGIELTDDKYNELYEKYLGKKAPEQTTAGYEALHGKILDLQRESGSGTFSEPSVDDSIKKAEDFIVGQDDTPEKPISDEHLSGDDEYFAMMRTSQVEGKTKKQTNQISFDMDDLQKDIKNAESFVEKNYSEKEEQPEPARNVDIYSTDPNLSGKKKEKPSFFKKKESGKKYSKSEREFLSASQGTQDGTENADTLPEFDDTFIDRLGNTADLLAYEPPLQTVTDEDKEQSTSTLGVPEDTEISAGENAGEEIKSGDTKEEQNPSDTAMMMMAFGYEPEKEERQEPEDELSVPETETEPENKPSFDEYSFGDTEEELSTSENLGDTSLLETDTVQINRGVTEMFDRPLFEYTDTDNSKDIFEGFKKKFNSLRLRLFASALLAAGLLIFEFLLPLFDITFDDVSLLVTVDWLLTFGCALLVCDRLILAVKKLGKLYFDADAILLLMLLFSVVTSVVTLICGTELFYEIRMYNFTFAVATFFCLLSASLLLSRDIYSFKVISSQKTKRVIARATQAERAREDSAFGEYLNEASDVCKVKKTDFISDFFANKEEIPKNRKPLAIFIPIIFIVSVAAFIISMYVLECDTYQCMINTYLTFMMCAPLSAFLSYSYPAYLGAVRAYSHNAAILSEAAPQKYTNTAVITFSDEDAFPADRIRMKSVKVLDNNSIEKVIYYASSVFSKIGGPLAAVFKAATLNSVNSEKVEIKELSEQGIDAFVDGKHIVVGQPDYMENQCFETIKEENDDEYGGKSNKRILYLACDEVVIAKFYIQYNTSPDFIYIVRHLYKEGICVGISTIDPCIDDNILYKNHLDPEEYAIKIVKGDSLRDKLDSVSALDCGVATTGSLKGMVKTLLLCDKLMGVNKTNLAIKIVSSIFGAAIIGLLIAAGVIADGSILTVLLPAVYQLFWLIPMYLVSKVYVR